MKTGGPACRWANLKRQPTAPPERRKKEKKEGKQDHDTVTTESNECCYCHLGITNGKKNWSLWIFRQGAHLIVCTHCSTLISNPMENSYLQYIICGFVFWVIFLFFHVFIYFLLVPYFFKILIIGLSIHSNSKTHYTTLHYFPSYWNKAINWNGVDNLTVAFVISMQSWKGKVLYIRIMICSFSA